MHGRSRMNVDPYMLYCRDGARRGFTDQEDMACTKCKAPQGVRRVACRVSCILIITTYEADSHNMDERVNELRYFPVWRLAETTMGLLRNCLVGALPETVRDKVIPLEQSKGFPPRTNDLTRSPVVTHRQKPNM